MNQSQHEWLNDTPFTDDIWFDMLVDRELSAAQRAAFIEHVRKSHDWQRVATAFLDEQVLSQSVPFEPPAVPAHTPTPAASHRGTWSVLAIAASLLIGGLVGFAARQPETITIVQTEPASAAEKSTNENAGTEQTVVAETAFKPALPGMFQASDTPSEAVYYTDFSVPQFLLDALVTAGHTVEIDQQFIGDPDASDVSQIIPMNVLKIRKYERLFAVTAMTPQ